MPTHPMELAGGNGKGMYKNEKFSPRVLHNRNRWVSVRYKDANGHSREGRIRFSDFHDFCRSVVAQQNDNSNLLNSRISGELLQWSMSGTTR